MLQRIIRYQRITARHLLAAFVAFWGVTAAAPCVMAAAPCHPAQAAGEHRHHDCQSLAKLDCQASGQQVVKNQVSAPVDLAPALPVLSYVAAPNRAHVTAANRPVRLAAEAIPRPPLILQYAVLLI
jgi:hypothetical protein